MYKSTQCLLWRYHDALLVSPPTFNIFSLPPNSLFQPIPFLNSCNHFDHYQSIFLLMWSILLKWTTLVLRFTINMKMLKTWLLSGESHQSRIKDIFIREQFGSSFLILGSVSMFKKDKSICDIISLD